MDGIAVCLTNIGTLIPGDQIINQFDLQQIRENIN